MVLRTSKPHERAMRLGVLNSVTAFAAVLATLFVWQFNRVLSYRNFFFVAAIICFIGAGVILIARRGEKAEIRRGAVFRWHYKDYYILTLLAGSRRHMNATFATFALVQLGHVPVTVMSTLFLIANLMAIATRPLLGKMIDKWGEGKSLTFNYAIVIVLFLGYAFLRNVWLLYAIFIIDNLFLGFDIAITTYLSKIAPHEDIAPSLAMGSTIQHIAAVAIPVLGGWLWDAVSPTATFLAGAVLCCVSLLQAYRLPERHATQAAESVV
jgi:MFS family permease